MKVITQRQIIRDLVDSWAESCPGGIAPATNPYWQALAPLALLNRDTATVADVAAIFGNTSRTDLYCDECGEDGLERIIEIGEEWDHESATARLCFTCISKARHLMETEL